MKDTLNLVIELVKSMAVVIVVAYLFTRTRTYHQVMDRRLAWKGRVLLIVIFGAFSVWGTLAGVEILGGIANTRDMGAALGGLLGGPIVGLGAGLIGAAHRLALGGFVAVPSALGAVVAGLSGGVVYLLFKRRVAPVWAAMVLALFTETCLMGLNLLMARPFDQVVALLRQVMPAMYIVNAIGMGLFVYIVHNEERERLTAAQKERMESELNVAREIQRGIVPSIFPPFPERAEFDLHASLESAREVGGDLYDFFLVDEDHLCLAIGDVSGKGVPASLFMAVTITLLRAVGHRVDEPDEVLARLNAALCRGNESAMFVTLFFGICDVRTGVLEYACGGHPAPYAVRADGRVEELPRAHGVGLGVSERARYERQVVTLEPGDAILLYTDGVTEAMAYEGGMFGPERIEEVLARGGGRLGADRLLQDVRDAVWDFAAGAEQYDDLTLLSFRRAPEAAPAGAEPDAAAARVQAGGEAGAQA
jgi:sigma-B regulation protein RsbU (phosphoserine phosphatase)